MRAAALPLLVGLGLCIGLAPVAAHAEPAAHARCTATRAAGRAVVLVTLDDLFTTDLARLVGLGLEGHIDLQATLVRPRPFWFDLAIANQTTSTVVRWSKDPAGFVTGSDRSIDDLAHIDVPRLTIGVPASVRADELSIEIRATLRVVTASSLGRVARWIAGRPGEPDGKSGTGSLVRSLVTNLAREARGSCKLRP